MSRVIDADGHVLETDSEIYEHLEPPFSGDPAILKFPFFPSSRAKRGRTSPTSPSGSASAVSSSPRTFRTSARGTRCSPG